MGSEQAPVPSELISLAHPEVCQFEAEPGCQWDEVNVITACSASDLSG